MTRRFAKIDVEIRTDPDFASLSSDEARLAFVYLFLAQKRAGGLIKNRAQLVALIDGYDRHLDELVAHDLVVVSDDGSISARTYAYWQSDAPASAERVRRWRDRQKKRKR